MSKMIRELDLNEIEAVVGGLTPPAGSDGMGLNQTQQVPPTGNYEMPRNSGTSNMPRRPSHGKNGLI